MEYGYDDIVASTSRLRELYGEPTHRGRNKVIDHIDDVCRRFIEACPFIVLATAGADGRMDISTEGDAHGFVIILDRKTLVIPDRPGNNRLDSFENLIANPG